VKLTKTRLRTIILEELSRLVEGDINSEASSLLSSIQGESSWNANKGQGYQRQLASLERQHAGSTGRAEASFDSKEDAEFAVQGFIDDLG
jgi:hypothetical protein